ncbi:MAG: ROK family glucokinase [Ndongobacter sp.]|nr:ROK family glucokinase [Ndongobacter sp.]
MKYAAGVDVGGMSVKFGFFDEGGTLLAKSAVPTKVEEGTVYLLDSIAQQIKKMAQELDIALSDIVGVGVGVPGMVLEQNFVVHCVNVPFHATCVGSELNERLQVPVFVANDANLAALGELWRGSGRGVRDLVLYTLGTGVGGGIVIDGKIVSGCHGAGGEIGHMPVLETPRERHCGCGGTRCLELVASATGIVAETVKYLAEHEEPSSLRSVPPEALEAKDVFDAAEAGDEVAKTMIDQLGRHLGRATAIIASVLNPQRFVIGGGVSHAGELLLEPVRHYFKEYAFLSTAQTEICQAMLGNDAGIYGAAKLAWNE